MLLEVRLQPRNGVQVVIGDFPIAIPPASALTAWDDTIVWSDSANWVEPATGDPPAWDDTIVWTDSANWVEPATGGSSWVDSGSWIDSSNWTE
jgi:hypothetical protein